MRDTVPGLKAEAPGLGGPDAEEGPPVPEIPVPLPVEKHRIASAWVPSNSVCPRVLTRILRGRKRWVSILEGGRGHPEVQHALTKFGSPPVLFLNIVIILKDFFISLFQVGRVRYIERSFITNHLQIAIMPRAWPG